MVGLLSAAFCKWMSRKNIASSFSLCHSHHSSPIGYWQQSREWYTCTRHKSRVLSMWFRGFNQTPPGYVLDLLKIGKLMLRVRLCPCTRLDVVMEKENDVCTLWLFTPQLMEIAAMWYQNDDWLLRGGFCDSQDPPPCIHPWTVNFCGICLSQNGTELYFMKFILWEWTTVVQLTYCFYCIFVVSSSQMSLPQSTKPPNSIPHQFSHYIVHSSMLVALEP